MYHFELKPNHRNHWEKDLEKFFDVFSKDDQFSPNCEILNLEKAYKVSLDVPGVSRDDLEIEVKDNHLYVSGERKFKGKTDKDYILNSERKYGKFSRIFTLPKNVNPESIEAHFENGVLDLTLPKEEKSQTRKIKISDWKNEGTSEIPS